MVKARDKQLFPIPPAKIVSGTDGYVLKTVGSSTVWAAESGGGSELPSIPPTGDYILEAMDGTVLWTAVVAPAVQLKFSFVNLTSNFSPANIALLPIGVYLVVVELYLHTTGSAGSITAAIEWTDRVGFGHANSTVQDRGSVGLVVANTYFTTISVDGIHYVTHQVSGIDTSGSLQYDLNYTFTPQ